MRFHSHAVAAAVLVLGAVAVHADEATTKPGKKEMHGPKLVQPYAKMTTLTPEEKEKISAIHKKAVDDRKLIDEKEESDIAALLSEPQKAELEQIKDEGKAKGKAKEGEKKAHATTEPAHGM